MIGEVIDRCPTGMIGFDKLCQGGFVRNSDNLIVGGPGAGKTTFLLQFLWNGITKFNENGLYCSFEPDIVDTLNDAKSYGWDFTKFSTDGKIKFMRFSPYTSIEELKKELTRLIAQNGIRRICFDPISILALNLNDKGKIRQTIFELSSLMKRLKVTTVFADESLEGEMGVVNEGEWSKTDILRFLSDSVTVFYDSAIAETGDRAVRISKMRRTAHVRKANGMKIGPEGLDVIDPNPTPVADVPQETPEPVPAPVSGISQEPIVPTAIPAPSMPQETPEPVPVSSVPYGSIPESMPTSNAPQENVPEPEHDMIPKVSVPQETPESQGSVVPEQ